MSEMNRNQFYELFVRNDPDLATSTDNFEFKYANRDILDEVIRKYHQEEKKNVNKYTDRRNYRSEKCQDGQDQADAGHIDVRRDLSPQMEAKWRKMHNLTDAEVERIVDKPSTGKQQQQHMKNIENNKVRSKPVNSPRKYGDSKPMVDVRVSDKHYRKEGTSCQTESYEYHGLDPTPHMSDTDWTEANVQNKNKRSIRYKATVEKYEKPAVKMAEIVEPLPLEERRETVLSNTTGPSTQIDMNTEIFDYLKMPFQDYDAACLPSMIMNEMVMQNIRNACHQPYNPYISPVASTYVTPSGSTCAVEDPDLDYELRNRPNYIKYCGARPKSDELLTDSIDDGPEPTFVEVEISKNSNGVNIIRNNSPLQFSEVTEASSELKFSVDVNPKKMVQQPKGTMQAKNKMNRKVVRPVPQKKIGWTRIDQLQKENEKEVENPITSRSDRTVHSTDTNSTKRTILTIAKATKQFQEQYSNNDKTTEIQAMEEKSASNAKPKRLRKKDYWVSKSIEDLKAEKAQIFNRMTATQERIIEILDKLRLSLLELSIPDNPYDKTKRQKNAFEFSVRFSRNFLYPLRSMINDIKLMSDDQFTNLTSNSACARIGCIYGLFLQSLNTYQKQLRYFMLDKIPQKLPVLIEMMYATTNICLEKKIFSNHDMIVDCLQQRVSKFIGFLNDMHEGRLKAARQEHRKLTLKRATPKYDLKMFMNNLNMYEPKLVPKMQDGRLKKKTTKTMKASTKKNMNANTDAALQNAKSDESIKERPAEDTITTQMEDMKLNNTSVTSVISEDVPNDLHNAVSKVEVTKPDVPKVEVTCNYGGGDGMDKQLIETLQRITKENIRQVLDPIFESLNITVGGQEQEIKENLKILLNLSFENNY